MSKHFSLSLIVPLIAILFFLMYFIQYYREEKIAYEDFILQKQINYSADAAVEEMLLTGDLGTDYATTYVNVQPDLGVEEFCLVLLSNLDMSGTDKNIEWLKQHYIKSIVVCAYDGLYVYDEREYTNNTYDFLPTPKIPYFYTDEYGTQYTLNFGLQEGYSDSASGSSYRVNAIDDLPGHITRDQKYACINDTVSYYLQESISRAYGGHYNKSVRLPAFASTISAGQPIKNISLIGIVETNNSSKSKPDLCMAIGGARIVETDPIIGFTLNGTNYYAPQSKAALVGVTAPINKSFTSEYEAAGEGYNCYLPAYERVVIAN